MPKLAQFNLVLLFSGLIFVACGCEPSNSSQTQSTTQPASSSAKNKIQNKTNNTVPEKTDPQKTDPKKTVVKDTPKLKKATLGGLPGPGGVLSKDFPEISVETRSSFAHDRGYRTRITAVTIAGQSVEPSAIVEALVKHRGGWLGQANPGKEAGKEEDKDSAKQTLLQLKLALARQTEAGIIVDKTCPADLAKAMSQQPTIPPNAKVRNTAMPGYHPPKVEIIEVKGQSLLVLSYFVRGSVGRRGRNWSYAVEAFDLKTGKAFNVYQAKDIPQLPQSQYFSEQRY